MEPPTKTAHLSALETMLPEVLARLPLINIARLKLVCKTWKSTLESPYFRRLFVSVHKNSSSSWSIMSEDEVVIGFYRCETWNLPNSPASWIPPYLMQRKFNFVFRYVDSSNGLILLYGPNICIVGNPVLRQWVKIPSPPVGSNVFGFVTRVDEDGVVLSFKVISLDSNLTTDEIMSVFVYSSETGIWTPKLIRHSLYPITNQKLIHSLYPITDQSCTYITLNGIMYFNCLSESGLLVAIDFYSESDQLRSIQFPDYIFPVDNDEDFKRALTTSGRNIVYMRTLAQKEKTALKIWKLNNDETWQVLWEIILPFIGNGAPMVMHPFDNGIVYLWSRRDKHVVSCDLRAPSYMMLRDECSDGHQDYFLDAFRCEWKVGKPWESWRSGWNAGVSISLSQFVLPRWMESVPLPPQVEMIDTTSLLSYLEEMVRNRD